MRHPQTEIPDQFTNLFTELLAAHRIWSRTVDTVPA
jgi:hypothetical protein